LSSEKLHTWCLSAVFLTVWAMVIFVPLVVLFAHAVFSNAEVEVSSEFSKLMFRSFVLAGIIAGVAVLVGYSPGRLLGTCRKHEVLLLLVLLMPLVLPRYVLYYAWLLLFSPTTALGAYFSSNPGLARFLGTFTSSAVLILWLWPLAALLIAQGWRNIDRQIWDSASLEASNFQVFRNITVPLLARPILLAFGVCFVLSLSEFTTFHLAGIQTIGTELAVLYELTGSEGCVVRAAWPVTAAAFVTAIVLGRTTRAWGFSAPALGTVEFHRNLWPWTVVLIMIGISLVAPLALLICNVADTKAFEQFFKLHLDELAWSGAVAIGAAVTAYLIAFGALLLERIGGGIGRILTLTVRTTIFLAMFVPASLVAVSLLKTLAVCNFPAGFRQGWYIVSAGQAGRFAGVALILLLLTRISQQRHLSEMAFLDGASSLKVWWHVYLPRTWRLFVGAFLLIFMLSITEVSATMVLLPAGLPSFAQRLLNQMHYARDQQVIASCLVLVCLFLAMAAAVVLLLRAIKMSRYALLTFFCAMAVGLAGCDRHSGYVGKAKVLDVFGRTGRGQGEFIYPRAIDIASDGSLFIVDKTGRIQCFTHKGEFLGAFQMPLIEAGKPTGLSFAPNGNLYVADTHYHRVLVFSPKGKLISGLGQFGQEEGSFIYPTDVAFSGDGRIFVSEYGGNDRISVFTEQGNFLYCFGAPGNGDGQLSRPSAICVERSRKRLYIADACNHRIAIYDFDGKPFGYIGSPGRGRGQLRYPYDLALLPDGSLIVCEYGNNRLQLFSPDGQSLAVYGQAGRQPGQLAYPWGVAVNNKRQAFVVDAGNNRIQVWRL